MLERSQRREVEWRKTARVQEFIVPFHNYSSVIEHVEFQGDPDDYIFSLTDDSGEKIKPLLVREEEYQGYQALNTIFHLA